MKITIFGYIGMGLVAIGIVLLVVAWREHRENQSFVTRSTKVEASVTELVREPNDDWSDCRKIRMEFIYQGEKHFYLDGPHCPADYDVGEVISLFFIPGETNRVFVNDFSHRWATIVIFGGPAAFLILLGTAFCIFAGIDKQ